jgi:hypothetical protein
MNDIENFRRIERTAGVNYPAAFFENFESLSVIYESAGFRKIFQNIHFCSAPEAGAAMGDALPEGLLPFMVEPSQGNVDYYCFDNSDGGENGRVVVFSNHAVVYEWESFGAFLSWAKSKAGLS